MGLWISFIICFLCNVCAGLISTLMPSYLPTVVKELSGRDDIPAISAIIIAPYIAGWTIGGFVWGFISDRIGRASALALSVGSFGLFTIMISFAPSWELVVVARTLSGFAVGGILVITPTLLSEIWPERSRSVILGIDSIGFPVGIFSTGIVTVLVNDWRSAFLIGAVPIVIGVLSFWALKESDNWKTARSAQKMKRTFDPDATSDLIKGSIIFGSMLIGLWGMFSWISSWVQSLPNDGETTGLLLGGISMMLLGGGGLIGGFISGWVSNALGVRRAMLLCFSGCFVMSFLLFGVNKSFSPVIYPELALLSLFFGISQGLLSIYIPQLFPYHIRGTYTGICFNVGRIVTTMAVFFVGILVQVLGGFGNALLLFAGIFIVGFVSISLTKDKVKQNI
jgi:MFS family permease